MPSGHASLFGAPDLRELHSCVDALVCLKVPLTPTVAMDRVSVDILESSMEEFGTFDRVPFLNGRLGWVILMAQVSEIWCGSFEFNAPFTCR